MNKYLFCAALLCLSQLNLFSQTKISGKVVDTANKYPIENATVVIVAARDSMLIAYQRTAKNGSFEITSLEKGTYVLLVGADNYADFTKTITIEGPAGLDLGNIAMPSLAHLLKEVVVRQSIAKIRMRGDTVEYRADSFYVEPNATVEDLLKILPGITVDDRGNITANGKKIKEVLVDGEPFFSDDPVLVTRNLKSNIVEKVQVYEKKSEQELFTGVKGRNPKTVIDLKLKPDKKKGYLGNIQAGAGIGGFHSSQGLFYKFNGKERFAAFAFVNNTGANGLTSDDISRFSDNAIFSPVHEIVDPFDTWRGNFDGKGYPSLQTMGLHYNNRWKEDSRYINANYKMINLGVNGNIISEINQLVNGQIFETSQKQAFRNKIFSNRVNFINQYNIDSTSVLRLNIDVNLARKNTQNSFLSETTADGKAIINSQLRNMAFLNNNNSETGSLSWLKKMHKKRRTLSSLLSIARTGAMSTGNIFSVNSVYNGIVSPIHTDTVDQFKSSKSIESELSGAITYTEPVSEKGILGITYGISYYGGKSEVGSYSKSVDQSYSRIDSPTTSNYSLSMLRQKVNLQYNVSRKKYSLSIGNEFNTNVFNQNDNKNLAYTKRKFFYNSPFFEYNYSPGNNSQWGVKYQGVTVLPAMYQLQPLITNTDPNNKFVGNALLNPSYTHASSISFLKFRPVKDRTFGFTLLFNKTMNAITYNSTIDSFARSINRWINVDGNMSGNFELNYLTPFPKWKISTSMSVRALYERTGNMVNGILNFITFQTYSSGLSIRKSKEKKYAASGGFNLKYSNVTSSVNDNFTNHYFTLDQYYSADLYFLRTVVIHADASILLRQNIPGFAEIPARTLVNAWISKRLLPSQALVIKASVNNLLNSNTMNSRFVGPGYSAQTSYDIIQRYFLLTVGWEFANKPAK